MNRASRRHIERRLRKLYHTDNCSICGSPFRHNTQTVGGIDTQGTTVLAGECCFGKVAVIFTKGVYSDHQFDFPQLGEPNAEPANEAEITQMFDDLVRRSDERPMPPLRRSHANDVARTV
jgi:hypothetical protein